jgi:hypothetical protein
MFGTWTKQAVFGAVFQRGILLAASISKTNDLLCVLKLDAPMRQMQNEINDCLYNYTVYTCVERVPFQKI